MDFWDLIDNKQGEFSVNDHGLQFVIISGDFPKNGAALPLGNRKVRAAALREFYLHKGKTFWAKTKINFLRIFNFLFAWNLIFRKKFVVNNDPRSLPSFLENKLSTVNGQWSNVAFSVYVGSRKFILPIFELKNGKLLSVAKIYFPGKESVDYGENEAKILNYLQTLDVQNFSFSRVLAKDYFKGSLAVILSSPDNMKKITGITKHHIEFLKQLSEKTGVKTIFTQSDFYKEFQKEIDFLKSKIPEKFGLVDYFWNKSAQNLKNKEFIFSLVKREFPFFEMFESDALPRTELRSGTGVNSQLSNVVLDWEQARFGFPPIFDVFSLLISAGRFKRGDYVELYEKNIIDLFFSNNARTKKLLKEMLEFWKLDISDTYSFFLLYLIDQLYIHLHVDHYESAERIIAILNKMYDNEEFFLKKWK